MKLPFETKGERNAAVVLVALWALLFLPNLRTNPNWYGDEGEWMEKSWTFIHGTPRIGPIVDDFIFPYPYPPLYMVVNGVLLRLFGNDIVVARALGAVTALAAGAGLFCSLATATNYFTYPLVGAVVATVAVVNLRGWKSSLAWRDVIVAGALACAYAGLFVLWYSAAHGW